MLDELVFARIPMPGYNGTPKDRGEVFKLVGARNDEKLIGLRYVLPFDPKQPTKQCDKCGRKFVSEDFYIKHKKKIDCNADPGLPTKNETAELIGADPEKITIEE
jgi:hypothetical protein